MCARRSPRWRAGLLQNAPAKRRGFSEFLDHAFPPLARGAITERPGEAPGLLLYSGARPSPTLARGAIAERPGEAPGLGESCARAVPPARAGGYCGTPRRSAGATTTSHQSPITNHQSQISLPPPPQPQGIRHHADGAHRHGAGGDYWVEQSKRGEGDADDVVDEGPE